LREIYFKRQRIILLLKINGKKFHSYKDSLYPFTKVGDEDVLVDQGKTLLNFILNLSSIKKQLIDWYLWFDIL